MRRQARKMRRYGFEPMVVMNSDDQLPDLIIVLIGRTLWRYRSELAPLYLTLAVATAAWHLNATHPHWWPGILVATAVVAWGLISFGVRVGLDRLSERMYAASVAVVAGAWLVVATALGPLSHPMPHVLIAAALVLAVPWWAHRRRRAKVRIERKLTAWPDIAKAIGLAGSRVMSVVVDVWGWRARFGLARGQTIEDVMAKVPAIESALGTFRGAVRISPTPDDLANRFELRVLDSDPHADAIPWPGPSVASITQPIELGPFEDATPARVLLLRRHALIGGIAGSGKSGGINVLMGNLSACHDVVIWAIDLKRGMELRPWESCIDRLATTPAQARVLLRDAVAILEARATMLADAGLRVWEPTPDMPALVIVLDEYAELVEEAADATGHADSVARRGRAVAVTLIAATQRPTQKAMGQGAVRSQMDVRISFRVRERKDVDLILGQGMLSSGWHAHKLNAPGKFYLSAPEHGTPRRARAYLLSDQAVAMIARRHALNRPPLDEVSQSALDEEESAETLSDGPAGPDDPIHQDGVENAPEAILWAALSLAPEDGITVPELMKITGMSRPTLYRRLTDLVREGVVIQVDRGRYRAANQDRFDAE